MCPGPRHPTRLSPVLISALLAVHVSACTPWPEYGTGGMAERHPTVSYAIMALEDRCDALSRAGAEQAVPGRMEEARLLLRRARREIAGDLLEDSDRTLGQAEMLITAIERYVRADRRRGS